MGWLSSIAAGLRGTRPAEPPAHDAGDARQRREEEMARSAHQLLVEEFPNFFSKESMNTVAWETTGRLAVAGANAPLAFEAHPENRWQLPDGIAGMFVKNGRSREVDSCDVRMNVDAHETQRTLRETLFHEMNHCAMHESPLLTNAERNAFLMRVADAVPLETLADEWYGRPTAGRDELMHEADPWAAFRNEQAERAGGARSRAPHVEGAAAGDLDASFGRMQATRTYGGHTADPVLHMIAHPVTGKMHIDSWDLDKYTGSGDDTHQRRLFGITMYVEEAFTFLTTNHTAGETLRVGAERTPDRPPDSPEAMKEWAVAMGQDIRAYYAGQITRDEFRERYDAVLDPSYRSIQARPEHKEGRIDRVDAAVEAYGHTMRTLTRDTPWDMSYPENASRALEKLGIAPGTAEHATTMERIAGSESAQDDLLSARWSQHLHQRAPDRYRDEQLAANAQYRSTRTPVAQPGGTRSAPAPLDPASGKDHLATRRQALMERLDALSAGAGADTVPDGREGPPGALVSRGQTSLAAQAQAAEREGARAATRPERDTGLSL